MRDKASAGTKARVDWKCVRLTQDAWDLACLCDNI